MDESKLPWDADYPVSLSIGLVGCDRSGASHPEFISPRDDMTREIWEALDFDQQTAWLDNAAKEWAFEYIEISWDVPAQ
jgi:hypothetical protein